MTVRNSAGTFLRTNSSQSIKQVSGPKPKDIQSNQTRNKDWNVKQNTVIKCLTANAVQAASAQHTLPSLNVSVLLRQSELKVSRKMSISNPRLRSSLVGGSQRSPNGLCCFSTSQVDQYGVMASCSLQILSGASPSQHGVLVCLLSRRIVYIMIALF